MARSQVQARLRRPLKRRPWRERQRHELRARKILRSRMSFKCFRNCNAVIRAATYGCAAPPLCGKLGPVKCSDPPPRRELAFVMNWDFHQKVSSRARYAALLWALAGIFLATQFALPAFASDPKD